MNNIDEALFAKMNREVLVSQLNQIGFSVYNSDTGKMERKYDCINENTPLSEIAKYMQWACGLLDIQLATIKKSDSTHCYFSENEWGTMSSNNRTQYAKIGLRIRAEGQSFIIAKSCATTSTGGTNFTWSDSTSLNVKGLKDYGENSQGLYDDYDGQGNTALILAAIDEYGVAYPAAKAASTYMACKKSSDGVDDISAWYLPSAAEWRLMIKYLPQINQVFTNLIGTDSKIESSGFWSSTEHSASDAFYVSTNYGSVYYYVKTIANRVRPCAPAM